MSAAAYASVTRGWLIRDTDLDGLVALSTGVYLLVDGIECHTRQGVLMSRINGLDHLHRHFVAALLWWSVQPVSGQPQSSGC